MLAVPGVLCTFVCVSPGSCSSARFCHICHIYSVAGGAGVQHTCFSAATKNSVALTLEKSLQIRKRSCFDLSFCSAQLRTICQVESVLWTITRLSIANSRPPVIKKNFFLINSCIIHTKALIRRI